MKLWYIRLPLTVSSKDPSHIPMNLETMNEVTLVGV